MLCMLRILLSAMGSENAADVVAAVSAHASTAVYCLYSVCCCLPCVCVGWFVLSRCMFLCVSAVHLRCAYARVCFVYLGVGIRRSLR